MTTGEYILKHLRYDEITQADYCLITGTPKTMLNEVIKGKRKLSVKLAFNMQKNLTDFSAREILILQVISEIEVFEKSHIH